MRVAHAPARRSTPDPRRVLEELIYERVRLDADLLAMGELEKDLAASFRRAVAEVEASSDELAQVLDAAVEQAFVRVAAELVVEADLDRDGGCPLCEAPMGGPPD